MDEALGPNILGRFFNIFTDTLNADGLAIGPILDPIRIVLSPFFQYLALASPWQTIFPHAEMLFSDAPETQESPTSAALLPLFRASAKPISISLLIYTLHYIFSAVKARLFHRFCKKNGCGILAEFEEIRLRCAVCLSASESSRTGNGRKDEARTRKSIND